MTNKIFTEEYNTLRDTFRDCSFPSYAGVYLNDLKRLAASDGPDSSAAKSLDRLRSFCKRSLMDRILNRDEFEEAAGVLALAGDDPNKTRKAAAFKMLRHLYLMKRFGGHSLWVLSLPKSYSKWPSDQFSGKTGLALANDLVDINGRFTSKQMRDLCHASQKCGTWANKAAAVASATRGVGATTRETLIKRWFLGDGASDNDVKAAALTLKEGYKKIAVAALSKKMVLTDNPFHRGTDYEDANAYVWYDTLNVVYIESGFFGPAGDPLTGLDNWTRILVHELSHSQLNTDDHAYRHQGIKPGGRKLSIANAIKNADSWAFFAADANGALSRRDRAYCLK